MNAVTMEGTRPASVRRQQARAVLARYMVRYLLPLVGGFALLWVCFVSDKAAIHEPQLFILVGLNALTLAGLYFIVASGFTLIFGLARIVNMAHGSFYMLGGFFAFELQQTLTERDNESSFGAWILAAIVASLAVGVIGIVVQQLFLSWNQGQELRQALITIAVSIIIADQTLGHFGGIADEIVAPSQFPGSVSLGVFGLTYSFFRIFVLALAVVIGLLMWVVIKRTRVGMIVRAGVDDRQMVSGLGINVPLVFAVTFLVGSVLAGLAGVLGGTMISVDKQNDTSYLLIALIVVIVGGLGSLGGAAVGALLLGLVDSFGDVYLPSGYENYSPLLIFGLLVFVLAVRPHGLFGRPG